MDHDWRARLRAEGIPARFPDHDHVLHVSLAPAAPPEWVLDDMAALTFRLATRRDGAPVSATTMFPPVVLRIGRRLGLDAAQAFALVDSHERLHLHLQLEGVPEEDEEAMARVADHAYLAVAHPRAEALLESSGVRSILHGNLWEELVVEDGLDPMPF